MKIRSAHLATQAALLILCFPVLAAADERPMSGRENAEFAPFDRVVLEYMDRIDCTAATSAIMREGKLLHSRGYGWSDQSRRTPTPPDALMRIASITKPITAAAVKKAARDKLLSLDAAAFELIAVKALRGKPADPRINQITVAQLIEHKGGWDRDAAFDPMFRTRDIAQSLKLRRAVRSTDVIAYMLSQPLQFEPGEKACYSNFGYCVLGRVLERAMNKPFGECLDEAIFRPHQITDIRLGASAPRRRDPREVWYPAAEDAFSLEAMDANGGLIASAPALCQFLDAYWLNGEPRRANEWGDWIFFGSLPGSTAMVRQRRDGYHYAVLFNNRRDATCLADHDALKAACDRVLDQKKGRQ